MFKTSIIIEKQLVKIRERITDNVKNRYPIKHFSCKHCFNIGIENYSVVRSSITSHFKSKVHRYNVDVSTVQACFCGKIFWMDTNVDEVFFLRHLNVCLLRRKVAPLVEILFNELKAYIISLNGNTFYTRAVFLLDNRPKQIEERTGFQLLKDQPEFGVAFERDIYWFPLDSSTNTNVSTSSLLSSTSLASTSVASTSQASSQASTSLYSTFLDSTALESISIDAPFVANAIATCITNPQETITELTAVPPEAMNNGIENREVTQSREIEELNDTVSQNVSVVGGSQSHDVCVAKSQVTSGISDTRCHEKEISRTNYNGNECREKETSGTSCDENENKEPTMDQNESNQISEEIKETSVGLSYHAKRRNRSKGKKCTNINKLDRKKVLELAEQNRIKYTKRLEHTPQAEDVTKLTRKQAEQLRIFLNALSEFDPRFAKSDLSYLLDHICKNKSYSNLELLRANLYKDDYLRDEQPRDSEPKHNLAFKRFFLFYTKYHHIKTFLCSSCNKSFPSIEFISHNKYHIDMLNRGAITNEMRFCSNCSTYFYNHSNFHYRCTNFYEHICSCVTGQNLLSDEVNLPRFLYICYRYNLYFDPLDVASLMLRNRDPNFVPSSETFLKIYKTIRENMSTSSFDWYETNLKKYLFTWPKCDDYQQLEDEESFWKKAVTNEKISLHCLSGRRCFTCGPEIFKLKNSTVLEENNHEKLVRRFGDNSKFLQLPKPSWLLKYNDTSFSEERLDANECGITSWLIWLAKILRSSNNSNNLIFCHIFLYGFAYSKTLNLLMSNLNSWYVLPNTCLCVDENKIDSAHRHVIVIFRNRQSLKKFNSSTSIKLLRQSQDLFVPINGNLPRGPNNENVDEVATAYIERSMRIKIKHTIVIKTPLHFFNVVNYVSTPKTNLLRSINVRLHMKKKLSHIDVANAMINLCGQKICNYWTENPVSIFYQLFFLPLRLTLLIT